MTTLKKAVLKAFAHRLLIHYQEAHRPKFEGENLFQRGKIICFNSGPKTWISNQKIASHWKWGLPQFTLVPEALRHRSSGKWQWFRRSPNVTWWIFPIGNGTVSSKKSLPNSWAYRLTAPSTNYCCFLWPPLWFPKTSRNSWKSPNHECAPNSFQKIRR